MARSMSALMFLALVVSRAITSLGARIKARSRRAASGPVLANQGSLLEFEHFVTKEAASSGTNQVGVSDGQGKAQSSSAGEGPLQFGRGWAAAAFDKLHPVTAGGGQPEPVSDKVDTSPDADSRTCRYVREERVWVTTTEKKPCEPEPAQWDTCLEYADQRVCEKGSMCTWKGGYLYGGYCYNVAITTPTFNKPTPFYIEKENMGDAPEILMTDKKWDDEHCSRGQSAQQCDANPRCKVAPWGSKQTCTVDHTYMTALMDTDGDNCYLDVVSESLLHSILMDLAAESYIRLTELERVLAMDDVDLCEVIAQLYQYRFKKFTPRATDVPEWSKKLVLFLMASGEVAKITAPFFVQGPVPLMPGQEKTGNALAVVPGHGQEGKADSSKAGDAFIPGNAVAVVPGDANPESTGNVDQSRAPVEAGKTGPAEPVAPDADPVMPDAAPAMPVRPDVESKPLGPETKESWASRGCGGRKAILRDPTNKVGNWLFWEMHQSDVCDGRLPRYIF